MASSLQTLTRQEEIVGAWEVHVGHAVSSARAAFRTATVGFHDEVVDDPTFVISGFQQRLSAFLRDLQRRALLALPAINRSCRVGFQTPRLGLVTSFTSGQIRSNEVDRRLPLSAKVSPPRAQFSAGCSLPPVRHGPGQMWGRTPFNVGRIGVCWCHNAVRHCIFRYRQGA